MLPKTGRTLCLDMAKKAIAAKGFGKRLLAARKEQGLTQVQLAKTIGSTQRALSYYENEEGFPTVPMVVEIAHALNISTDELLGVAKTSKAKPKEDPETRRTWKKFQQLQLLPDKDRRAVIRLVNSLISVRKSA